MAYINNVVLLGNLCSEVELRYSSGRNEPIATFRLAVGRDRDVCYIPIVVFGTQAENAERYLTKGSGCSVEGFLSMSQWQDKETGKNRTSYSVIARRITYVGGGSRQGADNGGDQPAPRPQYNGHKYSRADLPDVPPPQNSPQPETPPPTGHVPPPEGGYDDIPF